MDRIDPSPYLVYSGMPIMEALKVVNTPPVHTAFIVDLNSSLKGILTDGDFRRGLLNGLDLDNTVDAFMKSDPIKALTSIATEDAVALLRSKNLACLPLVTRHNRLVTLLIDGFFLHERNKNNTAVIMAGGKGSRLYPLTKDCPKPMLRVGGKPILEIIIEQCIKAGFSKFYISVNYLKEHIIDYFGNGSNMRIAIDYLFEDQPMGTAGSLQLLPKSITKPFLVLNGDLLTTFDYSHAIRFHDNHKPVATMCVREHLTQIPFGVVQAEGHMLVGFEEKPSYRQFINAGVYVIDPSILHLLNPNIPTDMPTLLADAQASGRQVMVCPIHEYWLDIGRPETLNTAQYEWINLGR